mmetsp:Transcript_23654/g.51400  ORF Transcript_23654/g.51400 Transcript_23654/m.51400 type:complete len:179 (-) Transcript_23654:1333-1869(-)
MLSTGYGKAYRAATKQLGRCLSTSSGCRRTIGFERVLPNDLVDVFKVVIDVERYPEFLPHCTKAKIIKQGERFLVADLTFDHYFTQEKMTYHVSWKTPSRIVSVAEQTEHCERISYDWSFHDHPELEGASLINMVLDLDFYSPSTAALFDFFAQPVQENIAEAIAARVQTLCRTRDKR